MSASRSGKAKLSILHHLNYGRLEESWVGFTEEYLPLEVIHEELLQEGLGSLKERYLRDNQVLLTSQDGVKTLVIVEGNRKILGKIFKAIEPWNDGQAVRHKVI